MAIQMETHIGAPGTEPPKVQMKSRRRKKMKKKIRTARDAITH